LFLIIIYSRDFSDWIFSFEDKSISSMIWIFRRRARLLIRFAIHLTGIFFVECYTAFS